MTSFQELNLQTEPVKNPTNESSFGVPVEGASSSAEPKPALSSIVQSVVPAANLDVEVVPVAASQAAAVQTKPDIHQIDLEDFDKEPFNPSDANQWSPLQHALENPV